MNSRFSRVRPKLLMLLAAAPMLALSIPAGAQPVAANKKPAPLDNTKPTLYVVGYAHLDTQWRWAYPQSVREYVPNTLLDNFKLMDKYPDYVFNFSGSRRYEMMREYYPADYEKLKGYVARGQWFPCGSSVDEGDANVPSGEALVRQTLYGNHFFRKEFGIASDEFMLPDCFGFPYALPTILEHGGIKGFSTQKLTWGSAIGIPFKVGNWIGPNGKGVVAALDPGAYVGDINDDLSENSSWLKRAQNNGAQSGAAVDYHYFGAGDRGGAPNEKSVINLEKSVAGTGPLKIVSSRADQLFNDLKPAQIAKLPSYNGELLLTQHSSGSITSQAHMKRWNRKGELLADTAERASVAATWLGGQSYPSQPLYQAWDILLGSQMHDILPGTSLPRAYDFSYNDEILAMKMFSEVAQDSVGVVSAAMDTRAQGQSLVVYNPLSVEREDCVEATIQMAPAMKSVTVFSPHGVNLPTQIIERKGNSAKIIFPAQVAPNGFKTFDARASATAPATGMGDLKVSAQNRTLENTRFRVKINAAGDIASVFDKLNQTETLKAPARLAFVYHNPSAFPAWNMDWADAQKAPIGYVDGPAQIRVVENGPMRVAIEVTRNARGSKFVQTISLASGAAGESVGVKNNIDWQSQQVALKAEFPMANGNPTATYDLQVGAIVRGNNDPKKYEVPQHQWFDLTGTDGKAGAAILNDCKFGSDKPTDDLIRLTLLYTPGVRGGYQDEAYQDFGKHEFLYNIAPHAGGWREGDVPWQAKRLNQPLRAFGVAKHDGKLGKSFSLARTNSRQVEIVAIKKAEDSDEIIVRFRELIGAPAQNVRLRMGSDIVAAREVDGQERTIGSANVSNGVLETEVGAFSLRAFALKLAAAPAQVAPVQSMPVALDYDLDGISSKAKRGDGDFDGKGLTFAAEEIPATLQKDGIGYKMGPTTDGAKNVMTARGQTISLPKGYTRVHVLAAASQGDVQGQFGVGAKKVSATVENWSGFVGQYDTRLWGGNVPELAYNWNNPFVGLLPGYIKTGDVAWYASHRHTPTADTHYDYSYLFHKSFDIPAGATTLTLPNDPRIKIFAVSVAKGETPSTPLAPMHDTLETHKFETATPAVFPANRSATDTVMATLSHPLYWDQNNLRYTLDGSNPTMNSPVYQGEIPIYKSATLKATQFTPDGKSTGVTTANFVINDQTGPRIVKALGDPVAPVIELSFSEPLDKASAATASNYQLNDGITAQKAVVSADGMNVTLTTNRGLKLEEMAELTVKGVKDASANGNLIPVATIKVPGAQLFNSGRTPDPAEKTREVKLAELPVGAKDPWSINVWCKPDAQPQDETVIAGFGDITDKDGRGRYITKFANGIHFWGSNRDLDTDVKLDVGVWQMITATYDGTDVRLYKNGQPIGKAPLAFENDEAVVRIKPLDPWSKSKIFPGAVTDMTVWRSPLSDEKIKSLFEQGVD